MHDLSLAAACTALAFVCSCASPAPVPLRAPEPAREPLAAAPATLDDLPCALDGAGVFYVASEDPTRPRVRYADGQVGMSDHCAIRVANPLNRRIPPVYVNGRPIGFC